MTETRHRGRWTMDDRAAGVVQTLPVEVPPGTAALTVELSYDRSVGVLDLGCEGPDGFRGWSGGARSQYTVAATWATPGYLPGELEPGTWEVLLGLHRVPPAGIAFEVRAETTTVLPDQPAAPAPPDPVAPPPCRDIPDLDPMRWIPGDFHSHTVHSDGELTVDELVCLAASRGLEFLAVTDHNTVSHHPELAASGARYGIAALPGQEVTTDLGHAGVVGEVGWVDFRRPADEWMRHAERHGGLFVVNHPLAGDCAWHQPLTRRPQTVELWHSGWWDRRWGAPLAWADAWLPDVTPLGGGDFHRHDDDRVLPGSPTTWVLTDDASLDGIVEAVTRGRTAISAAPDAPLLLRYGDEMLAIDADGLVLVAPSGHREVVHGDRVTIPVQTGMHRLETHETEIIAICN